MYKGGLIIAKQLTCHKYVYKLNSSRFRKARWKLQLPLTAALKNKSDIIALNDSQLLRFIDELNGVNTENEAKSIKKAIKYLKRCSNTPGNREKVSELYYKLYDTQFQPDYLCLIIDRPSDYDKANKLLSVNGIKYHRFLGTNGGVKNSTIIYVSERLYPQLKERLDCGRNMEKKFMPAKLEAYQALICSGSTPVSFPRGIIVVPDCITHFKEDVIEIDDSEGDEPSLTYIKDKEIELTESDGYGLALPALMERWNVELGGVPGEVLSGANLRGLPWTKGMVFPVDYIEFGHRVAENYMIKDAWGDWRDVRDSELILTTSMLKLWDSYDSWEDYWENVKKYNYQISIAKTAPHTLEEERATNYQFLQSYHLDKESIRELVKPTVDEIHEILGMDYRKSLLFLRGLGMTEENVQYDSECDFAKALMIEPEMINDPYVRSKIYHMIKKKIQQAKIGVLKVQGNFAIIGGDPYSLMQSMFGLPVTGLLKAGECYHKHWIDRGVEEIACFRAPMTSKYNIRKMKVVRNKEIDFWYQYIDTCMLLNSWDSTKEAENGADCDGDLFFTTNNQILLTHTNNLPPIYCIQRQADKKIVTEEDLVMANKLAFGDAIGSTTNAITSQICVQARFKPDSEEYKVLEYRIMCGQLFQQNAIDYTVVTSYSDVCRITG